MHGSMMPELRSGARRSRRLNNDAQQPAAQVNNQAENCIPPVPSKPRGRGGRGGGRGRGANATAVAKVAGAGTRQTGAGEAAQLAIFFLADF